MADAASAVGTYPREVRRVGWRYLKAGLAEALGEDARPKQAKMLDAKQQAAIVAMVCAPPPSGRSRWTLMLVAEEAVRRRIVAKVGRETIRRMLTLPRAEAVAEKNVVRPEVGRGVRESDGGRARNTRKTRMSGSRSSRSTSGRSSFSTPRGRASPWSRAASLAATTSTFVVGRRTSSASSSRRAVAT
ncbi:MAG: helix-turn-helix domain-containing protein [Myxococcales bacterium]